MNPTVLTCREAARLISKALDVALSEADRAALQVHVADCEACERARDQADFMRRAMARWRGYRETE